MAEQVACSIQFGHLPSWIGSVRRTDELDCLFLVMGFIFLWNLGSGTFVESVSRKPPWGKVILDSDFEITVFDPTIILNNCVIFWIGQVWDSWKLLTFVLINLFNINLYNLLYILKLYIFILLKLQSGYNI